MQNSKVLINTSITGVWGFFLANETYPIKRKILELTLNFDGGEPQIYRVKIEEFGWKDSSEVFMSRKEALQYQSSKLRQVIQKKREVIKFKKKEITYKNAMGAILCIAPIVIKCKALT